MVTPQVQVPIGETASTIGTCDVSNVACVNTDVADAEVLSAFAVYVALSSLVLVLFGALRDKVPIYTGRTLLRSLRSSGSAPEMRLMEGARGGGARGVSRRTFGWITSVLAISDEEVVNTAGLDALVFLRITQFGTQLFAPMAVIGAFALVPAHLSRSFYTSTLTTSGAGGKLDDEKHVLMRMTIANLEKRSELAWLHVCVFWVFTAYTLWLLDRHYQSYEFLRQVYGTTTGESNPWRAVHIPQTVFQKLLRQGMDTNLEFATEMNRDARTTTTTSTETGSRAPPSRPRRTSVIGMPSFMRRVMDDRASNNARTIANTSQDVTHLQASGEEGRIDDIDWHVLLEVLSGPSRDTASVRELSNEQKVERFRRASVSSSMRAPQAQPSRGYHSHLGPLTSAISAPSQQLTSLAEDATSSRRSTGIDRQLSMPGSSRDMGDSPRSMSEISMASMNDSDPGPSSLRGDFAGASTMQNIDDVAIDDVAIKHKWWKGLDIAEEVWGEELKTMMARNRRDNVDSSETMNRPNRIDLAADLESGKDGNDSYEHDPAPVPSIDDRRYIAAIALEEEDGVKREVIVSVLIQNYCVLMTDVGGGRESADSWQDIRGIEKFFKGMFPDEFLMVIPLQDYRVVDDLLMEHDRLVNQLEKLGMPRVQHRRRRRGLSVIDEINSLRKRVATIEHLVVRERSNIRSAKPGPSCIVAFKSQYATAIAAQCRITSRQRDLFSIQPAPGPDNINWQSVLLRRHERKFRAVVIFPLILAVILIPTGMFAGILSSLCVANQFGAKQSSNLNWYCTNDSAKYLRVVVQGILPPILLTVWETFVVSFGMMYLVQAQSKYSSLSRTDESFAKYYFLWAFLNVFFGTVSGFAIQRYVHALNTEGVDAMFELVGTSLPLTSNFFLLWLVFRGVYLPTQRLIFPHAGVLCMIINRWCCCLGCSVTSRDRAIKYSPRSIRLGREVGVFAMVMMIGLVFSTVAPIITVVATFFYVFNFIIWRYHVMFVYERSYESGGMMWNTFCTLTIYSLMIAQFFLSFVLLSKEAYAAALALWITILPVLSRSMYKFRNLATELRWSVPLPLAASAPKAAFNAEAYIHPALQRNSMGWHPEFGKVWRGYPNVTVKETRIFRR